MRGHHSTSEKSSICNVVVRPWQQRDKFGAWDVLREASFNNLWPTFLIALRRPATLAIALAVLLVCSASGMDLLVTILLLVCLVIFIYLCCLGATGYFLYGPNFNDMKQVESSYFISPNNHFWVAEVEGEIVGTVAIIQKQHDLVISDILTTTSPWHKSECSHPKTAWLRRMAVKKKFRGLGIAKQLVQTVINFCQNHGYHVIFLITTEVHLPARALYLSMGFNQKALKPYKYLGGLVTVWTYEFEMILA